MDQLFDQPIAVLNQPLVPHNNLSSFIYTNALLDHSNDLPVPLLHFWTLEDTVICGLKDQRLPHLTEAEQFLHAHHYHYFLRNSGGLAVVSDAGVLNCSLFLPWHIIGHELAIDQAYQIMYELISNAFPELSIATGEITHSYCPGSFDLSVNGQKIGGMAQRRNQAGVVVMLYLSVNGNQTARGELIRDFYTNGLQQVTNQWHFPDVWPSAMVTIADLLQQPLSMGEAKQRITNIFKQHQANINQLLWSAEFINSLQAQSDSMNRLQERIAKEE